MGCTQSEVTCACAEPESAFATMTCPEKLQAIGDTIREWEAQNESLSSTENSDSLWSHETCQMHFEVFDFKRQLVNSGVSICSDGRGYLRPLWDLKDAQGNELPSGIYDIRVTRTADSAEPRITDSKVGLINTTECPPSAFPPSGTL